MIKRKIIPVLLSSNCKSTIKTAIKQNENLLNNFDVEGTIEKIREKNNKILLYYYSLIENTDLKDDIITNNNEEYINDKVLSQIMLSSNNIFNNVKEIKPLKGKKGITLAQLLKNSKSKDLVTKNFKDNKYAMDDELYQKVATWSNTLAHRCENEIKNISESISFDVLNIKNKKNKDEEISKMKSNFGKELFEAHTEYKNNTNYACDLKEIIKNLNEYSDDLYAEDNINVKRILSLIKEHYPNQIVDKDFLGKYTYCLELQDTCADLFEMKNIATKQLLLYQDRTKEKNKSQGDDLYEDQSVISFIVPDTVKTKDNKSTCRVISLNKTEYDKYIKYNNNYTFSTKYIQMYSQKYSINERDAESYLRNSQTGYKISSRERKALMSKCAVSSYHIPVDYLEDFIEKREIKNINKTYPPIVENLAYSGSTLYDITPSPKKEEFLSKILKEQEQTCLENEKKYIKYVEPETKFNKNCCISDHFEEILNERSK